MSLTLEDSWNQPEAKTYPGPGGKGFMDRQIRIGNEYIDVDDFAELVVYFFTNTDLGPTMDDPRPDLQRRIRQLHLTDGWTKGNVRFAELPKRQEGEEP